MPGQRGHKSPTYGSSDYCRRKQGTRPEYNGKKRRELFRHKSLWYSKNFLLLHKLTHM